MEIPKKKQLHKRRKPKKVDRGKFPDHVRKAIVDRDANKCQSCWSTGTQIHHVHFKSQNGRGVYTNGVVLCNRCHHDVHHSRKIADFWREVFRERYGDDFYKDEYDI